MGKTNRIGLENLNPSSGKERMHVLDAMRGFALFGIILVNMYYFSGYRYFSPESFSTYAIDENTLFYVNFFALSKFYSLFSFLFGLGFAVQLSRVAEKGQAFLPVYLRRLGLLFIFGLLHTFIWHGDILTVYALAALFLIPFRNAGNRVVLLFAGFLLISPVILDALMSTGNISPGQALTEFGNRLKTEWNLPNNSTIISSGGFQVFFLSKITSSLERYAILLEGNRFPKLLGMFLIGFYFGKNKLFANPSANKSFFIKVCACFGVIGLLFSVAGVQLNKMPVFESSILNSAFYNLINILGVHPFSLAYMAGFTLLFVHPAFQKALLLLAPAGRMALTNYLMQSVFGVMLFYNIGFGLGPVGPSIYIPVAILLFAFQVLYSTIWLKRYKFGPLEWLWRNGIYGKIQPIRR
ncbi:MAG: DUF418 domain-containing protein [Cytophagaceae bacterium]